jgi:hypothetical protein
MDKKLVEKLKNNGFNQDNSLVIIDDCFWFTSHISEQEYKNTKKFVGKNHFKVYGYRGLFIGECFLSNDRGIGYYATSHIRGDYRGYKCQYEYTKDILNIFASGKTLEDCINSFIEKYNKLEYNITK